MARIYPFRALRYDTSRVKMEDVVTQPYDKITPEMQQRYYERSPFNLIRIILGRHEPGDTEPRVEFLVTDCRGWEDDDRLGLTGVEAKPHRRAEARVVAHRLRRELESGRAARDIVVLVRATASLRLFEEALEEQGVPTYVVGGRGYWSQQPVRDGLAYLAALANPLDEEALLGTLANVDVSASRRVEPVQRSQDEADLRLDHEDDGVVPKTGVGTQQHKEIGEP